MVIGFINDPYTALESDGVAFVDIGIISGSVQRNVIFELAFSSGSALGNVNKLHLKHDPQSSAPPRPSFPNGEVNSRTLCKIFLPALSDRSLHPLYSYNRIQIIIKAEF